MNVPATANAATWSDTFVAILKDNDVGLISYVPDNVLTPAWWAISSTTR